MTDWDVRPNAAAAGTFALGGDLNVHRLGFGAMRITGPGIWGEPEDPDEAKAVLRRAVELGINLIDTADIYGPEVSERLIARHYIPIPRVWSSPPKAASRARNRTGWCRTDAPGTCARPAKAACAGSGWTG
jgi:pyridoxine 4-dehydrogenase